MNQPFFGTIDFPGTDYRIPRWEIIEKMLNASDRSAVPKAKELYQRIVDVVGAGRKEGDKFNMHQGPADRSRDLALELQEKIRKPTGLEIQAIGGAGTLKVMGTEMYGFVIGAVGRDERGRDIQAQFSQRGIRLINNNEYLPQTREAIMITPIGGQDRFCGRFPNSSPEFFKDVALLKQLIKDAKPTHFFLESKLIESLGNTPDERKKNYISLVDTLKENNIYTIYSVPTSRSLYVKDREIIKEHASAFRHAARSSDLTAMNAQECVWLVKDPFFKDDINDKNHPELKYCISRIQSSLARRGTKKLVLITAGEGGMIGVTGKFQIDQASYKVAEVVNSVGAGDRACSKVALHMDGKNPHNNHYVKNALNIAAMSTAELIAGYANKKDIVPSIGNVIHANTQGIDRVKEDL